MVLKYNLLTAKEVDGLSADGRYADGNRLYLQIQGGVKSWVFIYRRKRWGVMRKGKVVKKGELGLGPVHTITLAAARKLRDEENRRIQDGIDPIPYHEERKRRLALGPAPTFREVAEDWMAMKVRG